MKPNTFLTVQALADLAFGILLVSGPQIVFELLGLKTDLVGGIVARLFGAEIIGFSMVTWFASRPAADPATKRVVMQGHLWSEGLGFVITLVFAILGVGNALMWGMAAVYLIFLLGFTYFRFVQPNAGTAA